MKKIAATNTLFKKDWQTEVTEHLEYYLNLE
jgi:hypothetical protein